MELFIAVAVYVGIGYATYTMAVSRGREPWSWTILSLLLLPIAGPILLAMVGKTQEQKDLEFKQQHSRMNEGT